MYRHGVYTKAAVAERRMLRELLRRCADRSSPVPNQVEGEISSISGLTTKLTGYRKL
jgi:hypothetical protein